MTKTKTEKSCCELPNYNKSMIDRMDKDRRDSRDRYRSSREARGGRSRSHSRGRSPNNANRNRNRNRSRSRSNSNADSRDYRKGGRDRDEYHGTRYDKSRSDRARERSRSNSRQRDRGGDRSKPEVKTDAFGRSNEHQDRQFASRAAMEQAKKERLAMVKNLTEGMSFLLLLLSHCSK